MRRTELRMTACQWEQLQRHLFPGDLDEHGAVILAGVTTADEGVRLIAREVVLAGDGVDYVDGERGYKMLTADFVRNQVGRATEERLAYIAVHCHGGSTRVALSPDDLQSQRRGYPALVDILDGLPVAGAVFATDAVAAEIWMPDDTRRALDRVVVTGTTRLLLKSAPPGRAELDSRFSRQALLFGAIGQNVLAEATVAVIGCGGAGSLLVELLSRLGVGRFVLVDDDVVEPSNVPRLVDASGWDAMEWLTRDGRNPWIRRIGRRLARPKVTLSRRVARRANPACQVVTIRGDVSHNAVALRLAEVDYLFLAADTFRARLVVNALAFQYGIPGVQVGAKVRVGADGSVDEVYSVVRPFGPDHGCLWCNDLIPPGRLAEEAVGGRQRRAQCYVEDDGVIAPSVITLNALAASQAANDFLFHMTGLPRGEERTDYVRFIPTTGETELARPRRDPACPECGLGEASRRARGDARALPTGRR